MLVEFGFTQHSIVILVECVKQIFFKNHVFKMDSAHDNCMLCLEVTFKGAVILKCINKLHSECMKKLILQGIYHCPISKIEFVSYINGCGCFSECLKLRLSSYFLSFCNTNDACLGLCCFLRGEWKNEEDRKSVV